MPQFAKQVLCINACQVPSNWLGLDTKPFFVETTEPAQYAEIQQVRFLAAPEMQTAPVGNGPNGLSNGFAAAVCACIDKYDLPPNASDWEGALRATWENLDTLGLYGADKSKFKLLRDHICKINRDRQCGLAKKALELAYDWGTKSVGQAVPDLSRDTLIDLHAHHSDQLALLMTRLGIEVFNGKLVSGPIHIVAWPDRGLTQSERKRSLIRSLAESLVDDDSLGTADRIVDAMAAMGRCVRVAFIEIKGPCSDDDRALIDDMKLFWQAIIARAVALGTRVASARLLIVGHVNPDPGAGGVIDSASYYHNPVPPLQDKRRLGEVHPQQLRSWLDDVIPHERFPGRGDIDAVIARALGGQLIDLLEPMRMARIVEAVVQRAG